MKFLFRSSDAMCLPQALRVQAEGNQVRLSTHKPGFEKMGDGLVTKAGDFARSVEWADVVVYDVTDGPLPKEADEVRKRRPTLGASELGARLEHDRMFGIEFAKKSGLKVPEVQGFSGALAFQRAQEALRAKPRAVDWVLKSNGKKPNGVRTFVSKSGREGASRMLRYWESLYRHEGVKPDFVLTTKIDGPEISTEAWFNGKDFYLPNHTLERNKLFPGDLGEKIGCAGNVVWCVENDSQLYRKLLQPLRQELVDKFVGPLDVNVIIEKKSGEPVFLEYSPRFGYDAIFGLMELFNGSFDFAEFLYCVANGVPWQKSTLEGYAGDVRVHIPPFPAVGAKDENLEAVGVPIFGVDIKSKHTHLVEVMLNEYDELVSSGPHGFVLSVTGNGDDPRAAQQDAYENLKPVYVPAMRYRNDLVESIGEQYDAVEKSGWLNAKRAEPISIFGQMGAKRR